MNWVKTQLAVGRYLSVKMLLSSLLQGLGVLWVAVEAVSFFSPNTSDALRELWWGFLVGGGTWGVYRAWPRQWVRSRVSGTDTWVEIRVCDLFAKEGAVVVGSNTTFDTSIEDETISESSIQGQFTRRCFESVSVLDEQLTMSLNGVGYEECGDDKGYGKQRRYSIGTVASVRSGGRSAYFVAIACLNAERVAATTREDVLNALPLLWEFIRENGALESLSCPILGSGFSRISTPREELIREIVKSFVVATRTGKVSEYLTIAVSTADFRHGSVDLDALGRFLEHECTYVSERGEGGGGDTVGRGVEITLGGTEKLASEVFHEELGKERGKAVEKARLWSCSNSVCPSRGEQLSGLGPAPNCPECNTALSEVLA